MLKYILLSNYIMLAMRQADKYTLNVRRENLLRAIRSQQRQQFKEQKRALLLQHHAIAKQADDIYHFRLGLFTLDLSHEQARVLKFISSLQECAISREVGELIVQSLIIDELICLVAGSLKRCQQLEAGPVVETLLDLLYRLLACTSQAVGVIERQMGHLVYLVHRFPYTRNLHKLSRFITCLNDTPPHSSWRHCYASSKLVDEEEVAGRLMEIYIQSKSYRGQRQQQTVVKQSRGWFINAIKCIEVVYGLLQIRNQLNGIERWESDRIKSGLYQGLAVFLSQKEHLIQHYDSQSTDSDSMGMGEGALGDDEWDIEKEESNLYFISVILDILLMKETVLGQHEEKVLKAILNVLLQLMDRFEIVNMTAIKVIKLLYQQLVLQEEQLKELAERFQQLKALIDDIIQNDFV